MEQKPFNKSRMFERAAIICGSVGLAILLLGLAVEIEQVARTARMVGTVAIVAAVALFGIGNLIRGSGIKM